MYAVLAPDLTIIDATAAYGRATLTRVDEIRGCAVFDVFPENDADPAADGIRNLTASVERVLRHRRPDAMALQRHDVRDQVDRTGRWVEKYWSALNTPLFGKGSDEVVAILLRVHDVSRFVVRQRQLEAGWRGLAVRPRTQRGPESGHVATTRLWRAVRPVRDDAFPGFGTSPKAVYLPAGAEAPVAGIYEASHTPACGLAPEHSVSLTGSPLRACATCGDALQHRLVMSMESGQRSAFASRTVTASVPARSPRRPRRLR